GAPFDVVGIALASHVHGDHFQPAPAAAFLDARTDVRLVSSPQVVESLKGVVGGSTPERISPVWPEDGADRMIDRGVQVDFMPMRHTNRRNYEVQNLGHLIRLGDVSFLHVGDAEMLPEHYDRFDLARRDIDVGLIPYWFFMSESGQRLVHEHIAARRYIAMHIPPEEADETRSTLAQIDPDIIVAVKPGDRWCFGEP
ncbi:MAG: MBL fold metallo-hydrolase, partial [Rhodothermales bacterium]|nr:MBL fold metallo-hydrolase [Rhodothermales bacterium]